MPREKSVRLFEVKIGSVNDVNLTETVHVQAYTKSAAIKFVHPTITARELGAVEAIGVKTEEVRDATK